jgi:hypothetical protein
VSTGQMGAGNVVFNGLRGEKREAAVTGLAWPPRRIMFRSDSYRASEVPTTCWRSGDSGGSSSRGGTTAADKPVAKGHGESAGAPELS